MMKQTPSTRPTSFLFVALDLETTGPTEQDEIVEVGAIRFQDDRIRELTSADCQLQELVHPQQTIPSAVTQLTGITSAMVKDSLVWSELRERVQTFLNPPVTHLIAHNVSFERAFLERHGIGLDHLTCLDTLDMAHMFMPEAQQGSLSALCHVAGLAVHDAHRAAPDALACGQLFLVLWERLRSLTDMLLRQIIAHTDPQWPYWPLFAQEAQARGLDSLNQWTPLTRDQVGPVTVPPIPTPQMSSSAPRTTEPSLPDLQTDQATVLTVAHQADQAEVLAQASHHWAHSQHRSLLLSVPAFRDSTYLTQVLDALYRQVPAVQVDVALHPSRRCDLDRLNRWKAGRTLHDREARGLVKLLYWCTQTSLWSAPPDNLWLFDETGKDSHLLWPLVCGQADSEPIQLVPGNPVGPVIDPPNPAGHITVTNHDSLLRWLDTPDTHFPQPYQSLVLDDLWELYRVQSTAGQYSRTLDLLILAVKTLGHLYSPAVTEAPSADRMDAVDTWEAVRCDATELTHLLTQWQEAFTALARQHQEAIEDTSYTSSSMVSLADPAHHLDPDGTVLTLWQAIRSSAWQLLTRITTWLSNTETLSYPQQEVFRTQVQSWQSDLQSLLTHISTCLGQKRESGPDTVHGLLLHPDRGQVEFYTGTLWSKTYVKEHITQRFPTVLGLYRGRRRLHPQGFLSTQLGLDTWQYASPEQLPTPTLNLLVPQDLPSVKDEEHTHLVHDLVPRIAQAVPGLTVVWFTAYYGLRQALAGLTHSLAEAGIPLWVQGRDAWVTLARGIREPGPRVLCGTRDLAGHVALSDLDIQCVVMTRLPFPGSSALLQQERSQRATARSALGQEFQAYALPSLGLELVHIVDILVSPTYPQGLFVSLDPRMRRKYITDDRGPLKAWPHHRLHRPSLSALPALVARLLGSPTRTEVQAHNPTTVPTAIESEQLTLL